LFFPNFLFKSSYFLLKASYFDFVILLRPIFSGSIKFFVLWNLDELLIELDLCIKHEILLHYLRLWLKLYFLEWKGFSVYFFISRLIFLCSFLTCLFQHFYHWILRIFVIIDSLLAVDILSLLDCLHLTLLVCYC